jgi:hypothetical protein
VTGWVAVWLLMGTAACVAVGVQYARRMAGRFGPDVKADVCRGVDRLGGLLGWAAVMALWCLICPPLALTIAWITTRTDRGSRRW